MKRRPGANRRAARLPTRAPAAGGGGGGGGIVTDNLVLHLDAGDAASYPGTGTTWTDLTGGQHSFTFNATPRYDSSRGFFNFNGNNWAQNTFSPAIAPTRGAVEYWFRWKSQSPLTVAMLMTGTGNWSTVGNVTGTLGDESFEFFTGVSACMDYRAGHTFLRDNDWHQVVAVVDGASNQLYLDGVPVATYFRTGNATSTGLISLSTTYIGRYTGAGYYFDGDIAIVRVYDTGADSFSAADVAQNYAAQSARFANFQPDTIDSLRMWIDPTDSNTLTLTGNPAIHVDEIRDKANVIDRLHFHSSSPNGPNLVTVGGMQYLEFDGVIDNMIARYANLTNLQRSQLFTNDWELHMVLRPDAASYNVPATYQNNSIGPSDSGGYWGLYIRNDGGNNLVMMPYGWFSGDQRGEHTIAPGDRLIFGHSKTAGASDWKMYVNGTSSVIANHQNIGGGGTGAVYLGRGYQTKYYTGLMGEMCFFNQELSSGDRTSVIDYLKAKWSL